MSFCTATPKKYAAGTPSNINTSACGLVGNWSARCRFARTLSSKSPYMAWNAGNPVRWSRGDSRYPACRRICNAKRTSQFPKRGWVNSDDYPILAPIFLAITVEHSVVRKTDGHTYRVSTIKPILIVHSTNNIPAIQPITTYQPVRKDRREVRESSEMHQILDTSFGRKLLYCSCYHHAPEHIWSEYFCFQCLIYLS